MDNTEEKSMNITEFNSSDMVTGLGNKIFIGSSNHIYVSKFLKEWIRNIFNDLYLQKIKYANLNLKYNTFSDKKYEYCRLNWRVQNEQDKKI